MFVCIRSQQMVKQCVFGGFGCETCFMCARVVAVTVFFAMWGEKTQPVFLAVCVEYAHWRLQRCLAECERVCIHDGG